MFNEAQVLLDKAKEGDLEYVESHLQKINWTNESLDKKLEWMKSMDWVVKPGYYEDEARYTDTSDKEIGPVKIYVSMNNCGYNLNGEINIYYLVTHIKQYPGFEHAMINYNNLISAHKATIIIPVEIPQHLECEIQKKKKSNIIFQIYSTGSITQSGPHRDCNELPFYQFRHAIVSMGPALYR
jgi:hypothetical protein